MKKRLWWTLGVSVEVFHFAFLFGVLLAGPLWLPAPVMTLLLTLTVMGQVIFLSCPLTVLSVYCFRKAGMDVPGTYSLTFYLYKRFGRWVGIPILLVLLLVAALIGTLGVAATITELR